MSILVHQFHGSSLQNLKSLSLDQHFEIGLSEKVGFSKSAGLFVKTGCLVKTVKKISVF